jgi:hypothetical protein
MTAHRILKKDDYDYFFLIDQKNYQKHVVSVLMHLGLENELEFEEIKARVSLWAKEK